MPDNKDNWRPGPPPAPPSAPAAIHTPKLSRVIGLVRGFTGFAGVVSIGVLTAEATLPADYKPSILIGGFHGRVEAADATAKIDALAELTRRNAEAAAQPPAFATMENDAFREQQKVLAEAMQTQSGVANMADAGCVVGQLIPPGDRDWGWLAVMLQKTCEVGDRVRQNMVETLKRGGQNNSVVIQRPRPSDPVR